MCRSDIGPITFVDLATLWQLLAKHPHGDGYNLLQSLVDFLKMPGDVKQWLPPPQHVSLRYAGLERLYFYPEAKAVAEAMLDFHPYSGKYSSNSSYHRPTPELGDFAGSKQGALPAAIFHVCVHDAP